MSMAGKRYYGADVPRSTGPHPDPLEKICGTCKFFVPSDHRLFDGACHNARATLGAVIQTSRGSTCKYHEYGVNQQNTKETK
jgi:hypothetical protein